MLLPDLKCRPPLEPPLRPPPNCPHTPGIMLAVTGPVSPQASPGKDGGRALESLLLRPRARPPCFSPSSAAGS